LDDGVRNRLERVKEIDQVLLLIRRETDAEALVIEVHYIHQSGCQTIMQVGRTSSESTQDRSWIETIDFILTHKADECRPCIPIDVGHLFRSNVGRRFPIPSGRRTAVAGASAFRLMRGYGATMSVYGTEQPVCLAVDPVGEVQDMGAAVVASDPEVDRPEAASRAGRRASARVDRDRAVKLPVGRDEGVDFAMEKAEVADKQSIAEPAEAWRCKSNAPRCGKAASHDYFLDEIAVFIKDRHGTCP